MSRLSTERCRELFAGSRIARFATVTAGGAAHLVPVTCALGPIGSAGSGAAGREANREAIVFAIDHKPKSTTALHRLANIAAEPRASFLADHYSEDWATLWWVRADVIAAVMDPGTDAENYRAAIDLLAAKYPQYRSQRPAGPVVLGTVTRWTGWSARPAEA